MARIHNDGIAERVGEVVAFVKVGPYDDASHYYAGIGEATLYVCTTGTGASTASGRTCWWSSGCSGKRAPEARAPPVRPRRDPPRVVKDSRMQLGYEQLFDRLGMTGYRYGVLLTMILGSLVFQLAAPEADWARLVTIVLQGITLLMALVASKVHRLSFALPRSRSSSRSSHPPRP